MGHDPRKYGKGNCLSMTGIDLEKEGDVNRLEFSGEGMDYPHSTHWRDDRDYFKDPSWEWLETHDPERGTDDAATIHNETIATTMRSMANDDPGYFEVGGVEGEVADPSVSEKQRRFMGAELARKRAGHKTRTGMSEEQLRDFARKRKK